MAEESDSSITKNHDVFVEARFGAQMGDWLEFVWKNHRLPRYDRPQTERWARRGRKLYIGSQKTQYSNSLTEHNENRSGALSHKRALIGYSPTKKPSANSAFSNELLYRDWKKSWVEKTKEQSRAYRRVYVQYDEAILEMHEFLDFMIKEMGREAYELSFYEER